VVFGNGSLQTGGGVDFFPSAQNQQLAFDFRDNCHSGPRCISYFWNGQDVLNSGVAEHTFVGFDLLVSQNFSTLAGTPARNLSAAGYTKVTFWMRGSLSDSTQVKVEAPGTGNQSTLAPTLIITSLLGSWQQFTVSAGPGAFSNVKEFFKVTFVYNQPTGTTNHGDGGSVFIDDIHFEK